MSVDLEALERDMALDDTFCSAAPELIAEVRALRAERDRFGERLAEERLRVAELERLGNAMASAKDSSELNPARADWLEYHLGAFFVLGDKAVRG